jgi:hypothetical protein
MYQQIACEEITPEYLYQVADVLSIPAGFSRDVCYDFDKGLLFVVDMVEWERKTYVARVVLLWRFESLYDSGKTLPDYYSDFINSFQFPKEFLELCQNHSSE